MTGYHTRWARPEEPVDDPEPLKHGFQGYWSRRITDEHRLVYKIVEDEVRIAACCYRYPVQVDVLAARTSMW